VVAERVALLAGAALALGERTDRLDERTLLVGEGAQRHEGILCLGGHGRDGELIFRFLDHGFRDGRYLRYFWYGSFIIRTTTMSTTVFPHDTEVERILVGPESVTWRSTSDVRLYAVMLYPLLLQVAHPTVGAGVRDYSDFDRRPWNRLLRTIDYVTLLVYGGPSAAPAGRRLREIHQRFKGVREDGRRYHALEPDAYAWVHATLIDTYVRGHRHFGRPMAPDEVTRFYGEYRALGRLIGVRERDLPETWTEFREYFDGMTRTELVRTESVTRVLASIRHAPPPIPIPRSIWRVLRLPSSRLLWVGGIGLLSPDLRTRLEIPWSQGDEAQFQALGRISRGLEPMLPERLRVMGPAQLRMRRRAIARGPLGPRAAAA
jgi:uncharacterized protein (DUF2236 family)